VTTRTVVLAVAKAPVPGRVKTRLAAEVGYDAAADLAAAALHDTLVACSGAFPPGHRYLALDGDLAGAVDGPALLAALTGWAVLPQRGRGLAERLAHAHADVTAHARRHGGAAPRVVQVGMDTPQLTARDLAAMGDPSAGRSGAEASYRRRAVLGMARDGGWWAVSLADPGHAEALRDVPMSTPRTGIDTRAALVRAGAEVVAGPSLRDVDTAADADQVARLAPHTRFARRWAALAGERAS
jgi:glycosyltransferase A (GT-A) superfamily protein (DUF2064 family)